MHNLNQSTLTIIAAGIVRVLARPVFHFAYHKLTHHMIHQAGHKVTTIGRLFRWCKWAPDFIMIGALTVLDLFSEGHNEHNEHSTNEATKE